VPGVVAVEVAVGKEHVMSTKTITQFVSDIDQTEIADGRVYQVSIRMPNGSTQMLDLSERNYKDLKLEGKGRTLKKRGRKPGSTTRTTAAAAKPARPRQTSSRSTAKKA